MSMKYLAITEYPEYAYLVKEWSSLNRDKPEDVSLRSGKRILWECSKCLYIWTNTPDKRVIGRGCPKCANENRSVSNRERNTTVTLWDRRDEFPLLIKEYSKDNSIAIDKIAVHSSIKCLWNCLDCLQIYDMVVSFRTRILNGEGCPFCAGKRVWQGNCLATTHPHLVEEWHLDNNITPQEIMYGSNRKIKWICKVCQYIWYASPNSRTNMESGCSQCYINNRSEDTRKRLTKITLYDKREDFPLLVREYSSTNTIPIEQISWKSGIKVGWVCSVCQYIWNTSPDDRVRGSGCPKCKESHLEKTVSTILSSHSIPYKEQYSLPSGKGYFRLDFLIEYCDRQIAIECQGKQHYKPTYFGGGLDPNISFLDGQERDARKREILLSKNIPLIEVPYWEKNIEEFIISELERVSS